MVPELYAEYGSRQEKLLPLTSGQIVKHDQGTPVDELSHLFQPARLRPHRVHKVLLR